MQNHFELFNLPKQFAVDAAALDSAYGDPTSFMVFLRLKLG